MDEFFEQSILNRLQVTAKALGRNHMEAHVVSNRAKLLNAIRLMVPKGSVVCSGGSMTLEEVGITQMLKDEDYDYYFRGRVDEAGNPIDVLRKAYTADWYFSGSNAITLAGELYNVDGNANRISAITFGPKNVVIVAGYNKVVKDLAEAEERVKAIAAPANCVRLNIDNECRTAGHCVNCHNDTRICCTTAIHRFQRETNRIKIFLLPEVLGY